MSLLKDNINEILDAIPCEELGYEDWVRVGMALKAEGYSVDMWDNWSAKDIKRYTSGECAKKWDTFKGENAGQGVAGGTIVELARSYGYESPQEEIYALDWDSPITVPKNYEDYYDDDYNDDDFYSESYQQTAPRPKPKPKNKIIDASWVEAEEIKEPTNWQGYKDIVEYLNTLFDPDEYVGYVYESYEKNGKWIPANKGISRRTCEDIVSSVEKYKDDLGYSLGDPEKKAGVWVRLNPLDGSGEVKDTNVTRYSYALLESDKLSIGKQVALLKKLELPIATMVHSGNKSVHAVVKIDAKDYDEYKNRVEYLYKVCTDNGYIPDKANKNPSRLTRLPGCQRGDKKQWLIATNIGQPDWQTWREWIEEQNDDLPEPETLAEVWEDMPELAPPLIEGILRQGHKMLISGPSKAGKSFSLIELCVAIAEGTEWLGWKCAKGKVLYVNLELDRASCFRRFKDVYSALGVIPKNLDNINVWNLRGKSKPMDALAPALIRRALKDRPIAVIIDPIYKVITGDENSADQMAAFCNQFDKVADSLGCAVIYCHHHSKGVQGAKRSMDRASGSGVFARDPDAILDLIELHKTETLEKQRESLKLIKVISAELDESVHAKTWRDEIPQDDQVVGEKLLGYARTMVADEMDLLNKVYKARRAAHNETAWRIEGTLREFEKFDPVNVWFDYPTHTRDTTQVLADIKAEGERMPAAELKAKRKESKQHYDKDQQEKKLQALREAMSECAVDGVDATITNVLERMPEIDDKTVTEGQLRNWVKKSANPWCKIYVKQEARNKEGILVDPILESALETF